MDRLRARINPSVSALSLLNFSGSAAFMVGFEENWLGGAICWAAATAAMEAAWTRLFWELKNCSEAPDSGFEAAEAAVLGC